MKLFQINITPRGSTGNIMFGIERVAEQAGFAALAAVPVTKINKAKEEDFPYIKIGSYYGRIFTLFLERISGCEGGFSRRATRRLIQKVKAFSPSVIHLHNLHASAINMSMLFNYIREHNIKVVWTLHDCWSFTGHCPHFDMIGCEKWKTECFQCPQYKAYPKSYVDNSKKMYHRKKEWFIGIKNLIIVTPSLWLADLVKQSFLKDYPVKVINNGIDLDVFQPTESDFRKKYKCEDKYILLGVAFGWGARKGLDIFIELAKRLDEKYQIVLVGTNEKTDKLLPENIISIHRTQNQKELAEIYTAADLFVNPTREENFPTVNIEALACGTPIVSFKTGGSPEIFDDSCGSVVEKNDVDGLIKEIERISVEKPFTKEACLMRAKNFDMHAKFEEYVKLYEDEK